MLMLLPGVAGTAGTAGTASVAGRAGRAGRLGRAGRNRCCHFGRRLLGGFAFFGEFRVCEFTLA